MEPAPLTLIQARALLYDRTACSTVKASLWLQIAERARTGGPDWPMAVVWLGLPGLCRTASRITRYCRADREDVEAELVTCYLEGLAELGPHVSDPGATVLRSACSRTWAVWREAYRENAVDDVDLVRGTPRYEGGRGTWHADYDPVPHGSGLSAPLRISVPAQRVEGVRLGALARAWGIADTATSVGHSGRGRQVATLSLRRARRDG
ncbi:hypothetical protein AB0H40_16035 [Streptomyces filamentosus]